MQGFIHNGPILCMNNWDWKCKNFHSNYISSKLRFPPWQFSESPLLGSILTVLSLLPFRSIFYSLMTIILMKSLSILTCCCLPTKQLNNCCCLVPKPCLTLLRSHGLWSARLLSMGLPRQEYWSVLPFSSPGIILTQVLNLCLLLGRFFTTEPPGKLQYHFGLSLTTALPI